MIKGFEEKTVNTGWKRTALTVCVRYVLLEVFPSSSSCLLLLACQWSYTWKIQKRKKMFFLWRDWRHIFKIKILMWDFEVLIININMALSHEHLPNTTFHIFTNNWESWHSGCLLSFAQDHTNRGRNGAWIHLLILQSVSLQMLPESIW